SIQVMVVAARQALGKSGQHGKLAGGGDPQLMPCWYARASFQDSDDRSRLSIQPNRSAHRERIGSKDPAPQAFRQDDLARRAGLVEAADQGRRLQDLEKPAVRLRSYGDLWSVQAGQTDAHSGKGRQ